jgi:hypothetical protein
MCSAGVEKTAPAAGSVEAVEANSSWPNRISPEPPNPGVVTILGKGGGGKVAGFTGGVPL